MQEYIKIFMEEDRITIWFSIDDDKVLAIGEKMCNINEDAYMNGYNWEAFFKYYLAKNEATLLEGLDSDPEAGTYVAYYDVSSDNEKKAQRFKEVIVSLIENEEELYRIVKEEGDSIEWD